MSDDGDECYEFHPTVDGAVVARQASIPKAMAADTRQLGYLHEGRLMRRRRRSVSLHADEQAGADISL